MVCCQQSDDKQMFDSINLMLIELVNQRRLIMSRKLTVVRIFFTYLSSR